MSYSLNTRGCVSVHAHYSNLPNFVCLQGQPRFQMPLNFKYMNGNTVSVCGNCTLCVLISTIAKWGTGLWDKTFRATATVIGNSLHPSIYSFCRELTFLWNYQIIGHSRWCMQHVSWNKQKYRRTFVFIANKANALIKPDCWYSIGTFCTFVFVQAYIQIIFGGIQHSLESSFWSVPIKKIIE